MFYNIHICLTLAIYHRRLLLLLGTLCSMLARSSLMQPVGFRPKRKLVDVCSSSDESLRACCANSDVTLRQTTKSTCQHQKTSVILPHLDVVSHPQASLMRLMVNVNTHNSGSYLVGCCGGALHSAKADAWKPLHTGCPYFRANFPCVVSHRMQMSRYKKSTTLSFFGSASTSRPSPTATTSRLPQTNCEMLLWVKCLLAVAALYLQVRH